MLRDERMKTVAEKLGILFGKALTAKRSPQHAIVLVEHESAVIKVIDLKAGAPGVIEPLRIEPVGIGLMHRIVPDSVIHHQRQHAIHRGLHRAIHR